MSNPRGSVSAPSFGFERRTLPIVSAVVAVARRLWPNKTAQHLASRAGVSPRAAEMWIGGQTGLSGEALAEVLRSDAGLQVLEALMTGCRPSWWPDFEDRIRLSALARQADDNQRAIEALRERIDLSRPAGDRLGASVVGQCGPAGC